MTNNPSPTDDDELVAELEDEATRLSGSSFRNGCPDCGIASNLASKAADRVTDLQARLERYRALLLPFALAADDLDDKHGDHSSIWEAPAAMSITAGQLREASKALSDSTEGEV